MKKRIYAIVCSLMVMMFALQGCGARKGMVEASSVEFTSVSEQKTSEVETQSMSEKEEPSKEMVTEDVIVDKETVTEITTEPGIGKEEKATDEVTTKATEKATEEVTTKATEKATTKATEKATTKATEKATTKATEKATTKATEKATTKATEKATTKATEKATTKATEKATTKATEKATGPLIYDSKLYGKMTDAQFQELNSVIQTYFIEKCKIDEATYDGDKIYRAHSFIVQNMSYGCVGSYYTAYAIVQRVGSCWGYCKAFKALCDAAGIPCECYITSTPTTDQHMHCEVYLDGNWFIVDPQLNDCSFGVQAFLVSAETYKKITGAWWEGGHDCPIDHPLVSQDAR